MQSRFDSRCVSGAMISNHLLLLPIAHTPHKPPSQRRTHLHPSIDWLCTGCRFWPVVVFNATVSAPAHGQPVSRSREEARAGGWTVFPSSFLKATQEMALARHTGHVNWIGGTDSRAPSDIACPLPKPCKKRNEKKNHNNHKKKDFSLFSRLQRAPTGLLSVRLCQ